MRRRSVLNNAGGGEPAVPFHITTTQPLAAQHPFERRIGRSAVRDGPGTPTSAKSPRFQQTPRSAGPLSASLLPWQQSSKPKDAAASAAASAAGGAEADGGNTGDADETAPAAADGAEQEDPNTGIRRIPLWVGIAIRLWVAFVKPEWTAVLGGRVEVATPVTSFKRLQECVHLFNRGIPPYDGGVCHQAPLLVAFFSLIPALAVPLLFVGIDYIIARMLISIAEYKLIKQVEEDWPDPTVVDESEPETGLVKDEKLPAVGNVDMSEERAAILGREEDAVPWRDPNEIGSTVWHDDPSRPMDWLVVPQDVGVLYLLSPYSIMACIAHSTQVLSTLVAVAAIFFAVKGRVAPVAACIAVASYLSLYPVFLLAPCIGLLLANTNISFSDMLLRTLALFAGFAGVLLYVSFLMIGDWTFIESTYGAIIFVTDLTPNVGLYWYFFVEVFDQFRTFFLVVFHITAIIFTVPVTLRYSFNPLFAAFLLSGFTALLKSYPSIADTSLFLALAGLFPEVFKYARHTFFALNALMYATFLGPLFYNLWVYSGAGNANFFYAITLVFSLSQVIFMVDLGFAMIRREWERANPGWRRMRFEVVQS